MAGPGSGRLDRDRGLPSERYYKTRLKRGREPADRGRIFKVSVEQSAITISSYRCLS